MCCIQNCEKYETKDDDDGYKKTDMQPQDNDDMEDIEKKPEDNDYMNVNEDLEIENKPEGSQNNLNELDDGKDETKDDDDGEKTTDKKQQDNKEMGDIEKQIEDNKDMDAYKDHDTANESDSVESCSNESDSDDENETYVSKLLAFDIQAEQRSIIKADFIGNQMFYHICLR